MPFSALSCRSNSFCFLSFAYRPNKLQASHAHRSKPVGPLALYRPYPAALMLKHFHDIRLVRQSQVQSMDHGVRHFGELEYRLYRILFSPANRIGNAVYSPPELKSLQEIVTLIVFAGFTAFYFREPLTLVQSAGFALIGLGAVLVFRGQS